MDLFFDIAGDQIDGARDYQEDAFLTTYIDDDSGGDSKSSALVIMADGMGGHAAGNIASNLVVSTFNKSFTGEFGKGSPPDVLRASLLTANRALRESIKETPALDGMGCTMVTAAFSKSKVFWVSVGDSHLYLVRERELLKQNEDHSYGGYLDRMKAQGMDVEAEAGLSRNMLMSAMTGDDIAEVDCPEKGVQLQHGDRVIIASDGLDTLSPGLIIQTSSWSPSPKECVKALLKAVEDENKPRQDNTTVIVVDVVERAAPKPEPVEETTAAPTPNLTSEGAGPGPGDTQPVDLDEIRAFSESQERSGNAKFGWIIGILVVLLIAMGGAGAYLFLGKTEAPSKPPKVVQKAPPEPVEKAPETSPPEPSDPPANTTAGTTTAPGTPAGPTTTTAQSGPAPTTPAKPPTESAKSAIPTGTAPAASGTKEFTDKLATGGEGPPMVVVPAGTFMMGSGGLSVENDQRPQRTVSVGSFAMSKYEVTFQQYERFAKATNRSIPDNLFLDKNDHPVLFVSWDDAYSYTQWLSKETGKRYRLPSEAEWEYAASGGSNGTPFWWGFDLEPNMAHCFDCKTGLNPRRPTNIGRFGPNQFGLHDTAGNVFEWVHDCYHDNYNGAPSTGSVWEGGDCAYRVARGGAYTSTSKSIKIQKRAKFKSQGTYDAVGIRIARDL